MPAPTHRVPPLVRVTVDGVALYGYLLEWVGEGGARVGWCEQYQTRPGTPEPYHWRWVVDDVPKDDVEKLEGQSYTAVPTGGGVLRKPKREEDTRSWRELSRGDRP